MFEEGATMNRRPEVVDETGPSMDFIDIDMLPLPEEDVSNEFVDELLTTVGHLPAY